MTILYFTSTGNSLEVAKKLNGNLLSIPQLIKSDTYDIVDDEVGIIFPVYAFGMPTIVKEYLQKANIKASYTFVIATYGNIAGPTLYNTKKLFNKKNININYFNSILMVDNYLELFDMDNQVENIGKKNIDENLNNILLDIKNKVNNKPNQFSPFNLLTPLLDMYINKHLDGNTAKSFIVNDKCTLCKTCEKVCPTKNISVNESVTFASSCISCLGCVHHCPVNAIHIKKEKSSARYINKNVTLTEIIKSNNQM